MLNCNCTYIGIYVYKYQKHIVCHLDGKNLLYDKGMKREEVNTLYNTNYISVVGIYTWQNNIMIQWFWVGHIIFIASLSRIHHDGTEQSRRRVRRVREAAKRACKCFISNIGTLWFMWIYLPLYYATSNYW